MNIEQTRDYCLSKSHSSESFPFNETILVFKVLDKMFALLDLEKHRINLKCEPQKALELRENFDFVIPGFHMNKKHWNTIVLNQIHDKNLVIEMIDNSYDLVVKKFTKKQKIIFKNI